MRIIKFLYILCASILLILLLSSKGIEHSLGVTQQVDSVSNPFGQMKIYPNPMTRPFLAVSFSVLPYEDYIDYSIYTLQSELVYQSRERPSTITFVPVLDLKQGFYVLQILSPDRLYAQIIIKE